MKAVIHIGTAKTGTTTIQKFLGKNRKNLKTQNIFIPAGNNHTTLAAATFISALREPLVQYPVIHTLGIPWFAHHTLKKGFTVTDQNELWEQMRHEIETNCRKDDLVIFSCEGFAEFAAQEVERVKELLDSLFDDITVVLYVRRQPEAQVSYYNTICGAGLSWNFSDHMKMTGPFGCPFLDYHSYDKIVKRWSIFGKNKLKIRVFDKQAFHENDLLSDFALTAGFGMAGLECIKDANVSMGSAETEFLRLLNPYIPRKFDPWTYNTDRGRVKSCFKKIESKADDKKGYYLNRDEARQILDQYREGNDWVAREYLGKEKLFDEDVSMYPVEVTAPHHLTLERSIEISAELVKYHALEIQNRDTKIQHQQAEVQRLQTKIQSRDVKIQRLQTEIQRLLHRRSKRLSYRCKALLTWLKRQSRRSKTLPSPPPCLF